MVRRVNISWRCGKRDTEVRSEEQMNWNKSEGGHRCTAPHLPHHWTLKDYTKNRKGKSTRQMLKLNRYFRYHRGALKFQKHNVYSVTHL